MDYTLFLLSAAKERYETHRDSEHAMIGSVAASGRVVLSAAAVMVAVFLTFAVSGPLAPKEMGVILAVAVAFDAVLVRLVLLPVLLRAGRHHAWHRPRWLAGTARCPLLPLSRLTAETNPGGTPHGVCAPGEIRWRQVLRGFSRTRRR